MFGVCVRTFVDCNVGHCRVRGPIPVQQASEGFGHQRKYGSSSGFRLLADFCMCICMYVRMYVHTDVRWTHSSRSVKQ